MFLIFVIGMSGCLVAMYLWYCLAKMLDSVLDTRAFTAAFKMVLFLFTARAVYKTGKELL